MLSEVGTGGEHDIVFTAVCQHLEFVRRTAADRAGIGLHRAESCPMWLKILLYASYIARKPPAETPARL